MPPKQGQRAPSDIRRPAVTGAPVGRRVVNPRGVSGFRRLLDGGTRALGRHRALGAADLGLEPYPGRGDPDATRSCTRTESRRSAPSCGCARHNTHTRVLPAIMFSASQAPVRSPLHPQVSHDRGDWHTGTRPRTLFGVGALGEGTICSLDSISLFSHN